MAELKRYKVELFCKIIAFHDMVVEADTPEEAERIACSDAAQLSTHDWDLSEVDDIEPNTGAYEIASEAEVAEIKKFYSEDWTRVVVPPKNQEGGQ